MDNAVVEQIIRLGAERDAALKQAQERGGENYRLNDKVQRLEKALAKYESPPRKTYWKSVECYEDGTPVERVTDNGTPSP